MNKIIIEAGQKRWSLEEERAMLQAKQLDTSKPKKDCRLYSLGGVLLAPFFSLPPATAMAIVVIAMGTASLIFPNNETYEEEFIRKLKQDIEDRIR